MRKLLIHIGPHKTGTTSIQQFLVQKRKEIQRLGVDVYLERDAKGRARGNAWALAHCFIRSCLATPMRLNGSEGRELPDSEQHVADFRTWVLQSPASTILISSEAFSFLRTTEEAVNLDLCFKDLFEEVMPIAVFRNDEKRRFSWTKQLENMDVLERLAKVEPDDRVDAEWYFDWESLMAFWSQFGAPQTIDYDSALNEDGSILPAFLSTTNLGAIEFEGDPFLNQTLNRSSGWRGSLQRMKRHIFRP